MYDNNMDKSKVEDNEKEILEEKKLSCILLKEIAIEFEQQLYSVKVQLKLQMDLLDEKQLDLQEQERTRIHNMDLFSPIYNKANESRAILSDIKKLENKIKVLSDEQNKLLYKIDGLKAASGYLDHYNVPKDNNSTDKKCVFHEKGLSILEAQEIERQRIARELHDTTVQNLTSLVHKSELCNKLIDIDSTRAKLELKAMSNTIKMVINDMRGIIYNLKPMSLDDLGLTVTVERYANRLMDLNNINVEVNSNKETKDLLPIIKLTIFRIIQEACNNVIKHANADEIIIDIIYENNYLRVNIKDDGDGFELNKQKEVLCGELTSFGLSIMQERISVLSGKVEIESEKDIGTIVSIYVPLTMHEGDKDE